MNIQILPFITLALLVIVTTLFTVVSVEVSAMNATKTQTLAKMSSKTMTKSLPPNMMMPSKTMTKSLPPNMVMPSQTMTKSHQQMMMPSKTMTMGRHMSMTVTESESLSEGMMNDHSPTATQEHGNPPMHTMTMSHQPPTGQPSNTTNATTETPKPSGGNSTTPAPPPQPPMHTLTREMSRSHSHNNVEPSSTTSTSAATTNAPATSSSTAAPTQSQQNTTSATSTMSPMTTTATPAPPKGNPRVQFVLTSIARARSNTTAANFKTLLAQMLSIPANSMSVSYEESSGVMTVEFVADAKDSSGNPVNVTAEFEKAVTLDSAELSNLGAASVTSIEPEPATNAPEEEKPNLGLIIGAAAGGFIFLLIVLFIIKKQSSSGTGSASGGYAETEDPNGANPMLTVPQRQQPGHAQL